ncbi:hypothetical protein K1719_033631 [Acacia pycnantha]|nr:hypothetical protein K1719_033631 [Acacia pycnantha]
MSSKLHAIHFSIHAFPPSRLSSTTQDLLPVVFLFLEVNDPLKPQIDGQTTFHSHSDISEVVFNYNHPAVVDFRLKLNISSWMGPP